MRGRKYPNYKPGLEQQLANWAPPLAPAVSTRFHGGETTAMGKQNSVETALRAYASNQQSCSTVMEYEKTC